MRASCKYAEVHSHASRTGGRVLDFWILDTRGPQSWPEISRGSI